MGIAQSGRGKHSGRSGSWKRFSEVVRLAERGVPWHVSVHGRAVVVVLSAADYARLAPAAFSDSFASLFATSPLARMDDLDDLRERSPMRNALMMRF